MGPHPIQLLVVVVVALLVFGGRGRISSIMGDLAKGVRSFRDGIKDPQGDDVEKKPMVDVTPNETKSENSQDS